MKSLCIAKCLSCRAPDSGNTHLLRDLADSSWWSAGKQSVNVWRRWFNMHFWRQHQRTAAFIWKNGDIILKTQASPVFTDDDVTLCYQHQSGKHKQTSFFKNGALIDSNSSSGSDRVVKMTLKNVTREDEGFYRCASHDRQLQSPESWLSERPDRGQLNIVTLLCVL
ncbi:unnamed protein product [Pleuronectes platessa]|uniref:Immunoglobulin V-set domain-containing protein n=1 Tax=Pleuronectes platessa TaxID=8262 RepID=A0A9N7YYB3_PLEPL|nr:unnamed protein product [Pleuronectes platessa]